MKNLTSFFASLETLELKTNENANGSLTIQQTQRNSLRAAMMQAFKEDLLDEGFDVFETSDGIILAVENDELGTISIEAKLTIKALDYDPVYEAEAFEMTQMDKAADKARKAEAKARKIAADTAARAKKAALEPQD